MFMATKTIVNNLTHGFYFFLANFINDTEIIKIENVQHLFDWSKFKQGKTDIVHLNSDAVFHREFKNIKIIIS